MKCFLVVFLLFVSSISGRVLHQDTVTATSIVSAPGSFSSGTATATVGGGAPPVAESAPARQAQRSRPQLIDIYLLADTTATMSGALSEIRNQATEFVQQLYGLSNNVRVGVGSYRDTRAATPFRNILSLQADQSQVVSAINSGYTAARNGPRTQLNALQQVATNSGIGFRANSVKIIAWIGNAPGVATFSGVTEQTATTALTNNGFRVMATNVGSLDQSGQATRITEATNGLLQTVSVSDSSASSEATSGTGTATAASSGPTTTVLTTRTSGGSSMSSASTVSSLTAAIVQGISSII